MSDPDSAQRHRPPTIDLTAQEVATERPADAPESVDASAASADSATNSDANDSRSGRTMRSVMPFVFAGLVGAAVVAAVAAGLWFTGLAPPRGSEVSQSASGPPPGAAPDSARMSAIEAQLEKLQGASQTKPADAGLTPRLSDMETQTKALRDSVAALTRRVDEIAASARDLATEGKAAAAAAAAAADEAKAAAQSKTQSGDLDQIAKRLDALESAVKALTTDTARASSGADDHLARAAAAAAALAAVMERGAPFNAELGSVTALGGDENAIATLTPFAASGLPSNATLSRELIELMPALRQASSTAAPKDGSFIARLELNAQKLVRITRTDSPSTSGDPSSIVTRIDADARNGDIAAALVDIGRLPAPARAVTDAWVKKAQAREAAIAASRRIAAEAAAALGKPAPQ
jgi:hypothetical protein